MDPRKHSYQTSFHHLKPHIETTTVLQKMLLTSLQFDLCNSTESRYSLTIVELWNRYFAAEQFCPVEDTEPGKPRTKSDLKKYTGASLLYCVINVTSFIF